MAGNREETGPSFDPSKTERGIPAGSTDPAAAVVRRPRSRAQLGMALGILGTSGLVEKPPVTEVVSKPDVEPSPSANPLTRQLSPDDGSAAVLRVALEARDRLWHGTGSTDDTTPPVEGEWLEANIQRPETHPRNKPTEGEI